MRMPLIKVVEQYGILTSTDNSKSNGSQYYENATSTDFQNQDYFTIRAELREAILLFLFNGIEYDHAQSIAGVNFGKEYKDAYFGVGLGASGHFIQIEDSYLEKEGTLPFSKTEISQKSSYRLWTKSDSTFKRTFSNFKIID